MKEMTMNQRVSSRLLPVAALFALAVANLPVNVAQANAGFGTVTDIAGQVVNVPTYYASSPQGIRPAFDPVTHALSTTGLTVDTGTPIRKFVDPLGGVYNGLETLNSLTDLQAGIPVALPEFWTNLAGNVTTDNYYEIAVVEYTEQLHSDLAKPTRLRGYVQIETPNLATNKNCVFQNLGKSACTDITTVVPSEHVKALYPDGSSILDAYGAQVYFVHKPHYLGPSIVAASGTPIRIKFTNYLPYRDRNGTAHGSPSGGEYYLPIDETIAGGGPVTLQAGVDANGNPVAGPVLDQNGKPIKFSQNRVSIHWHGGDSPWTNDGTPHQWFTPRGDISYYIGDATHPAYDPATNPTGRGMGVGDSYNNVPDMADPGQGSQTLYYPVNLSGRLMMYHDHVSGLTKINAYAGEAAGLIVYDMTELSLAATALGINLALPTGTLASAVPLLDTVGIPLVIQDKGFLPKNVGPNAVASDGKTPASQDAKWDLTHWGQPGDLFFPHVYETNQDPNSIDGTNPVGRWDWGPWFWPVFPAQYSLPTGVYGDVTASPEAFLDTTMVNGQPYPTMTVEPKAYRFRILSIGNDRSLNLGFYQAVDAAGKVCDTTANPTPAASPTAPGGVASPFIAGDTGAPATCTEVRMVPAQPTAGFPATWPTDGRVGGVPDPATSGPDIVQIGNEAGLLPAVAVWKSQPVTYEQNVRSITVFNILEHALTLMPGERADVLVDFTNYAGQTLILYNDAPAPMPGYDPRIDYYTGVGDQTAAGGAYDTLPGYGPNTRTVMQFKVGTAKTSGGPLNMAALTTGLPVAYAATQPAPIVPESVYNQAFGTAQLDTYAKIGTGSGTAPYWVYPVNGGTTVAGSLLTLLSINVTTPGSNYPAATTVTIDPPLCTPVVAGTACAQATATPTISGGRVTGFSAFNAGAGYTTVPNVTFSAFGTDGTRATALIMANGFKVINKAIQELFDPVFGRMNATLAAELPFSTATIATTVPLAYIDTPIEYLDAIKDGETQIWKVTHNGVDSHPVHFHLVNVQVINRVGWDGVVKPPAANEVGWKETLRMNPLEDVYVAVKAVHPVVPFGLPASHRVLDPSQAVGSTMYFTNIDPTTGGAPTFQTQLVGGVNANVPTGTYSNQLTDFDNEYVWHCHILGHEEFDFMRPFVFHPNVVVPDAPAAVTVSGTSVTWVDTTPVGGQDAQGIPTAGTNSAYPTPTSSPKNEIGFKVFVGQLTPLGGAASILDANGYVKAGAVPAAVVPANVTTATVPGAIDGFTTVVAYNAAGNSVAGTKTTTFTPGTNGAAVPPATTPGTTAVTGALIDITGKIVTLPAAPVPALVVGASVSGGGFPAGTVIATITSPTTFTTSLASTAVLPVVAPGVALTISQAAAAALPTPAASAGPGGLTQTLNANGTTTLTWNPVPGASSYTVSITETPSGATASNAPVVYPVNTVSTTALTATIDPTGNTVLVTSVAGLFVGETVSGGGFPAGTSIATINAVANSFTTTAQSTTPNVTGQALTASGIAPTFTTPAALVSGSTYAFSVTATTPAGTTVAATAGLTNSPTVAPVAFGGVADAVGSGAITLTWANAAANKNNVAALRLTWTGGTKDFAPTTTGATVIGFTPGTSVSFSLQAISNVAAFNSSVVSLAAIVAP